VNAELDQISSLGVNLGGKEETFSQPLSMILSHLNKVPTGDRVAEGDMVDERKLVVPRTTGVKAIVGVTNAGASDIAGELGDPVVSQSPVGAAVEAGMVVGSAGDMKPLVAGVTSGAQAAPVGDAGVEDQREETGSGMTHLATC
jgi:hypothetical protein